MASGTSAVTCGPPSVFVVDNDDAVRDALQLLFRSYGMEVESYRSAEAFCDAYRPRPNACLILDQHLEKSTGLASKAWSVIRIPVILLTGAGSAALQRQALAAGVAAYLEKPAGPAQLLAAVREAVSARHGLCASTG